METQIDKQSPNDLKLTDVAVGNGESQGGGQASQVLDTQSVGGVRCSAWLGDGFLV